MASILLRKASRKASRASHGQLLMSLLIFSASYDCSVSWAVMPMISIHNVTYSERSRKGMTSRQLDWQS
ncbi:hypothetical protein CSPAE12_01792 [Colletotrichum incanum]|nr:hypothetical protein CSPAE12_01792 [Colletotrichum incanum]